MQAEYIPSQVIPEENIICSLVIGGEPATKTRARYSARGVHSDKSMVAAQRAIGWEVKAAYPGIEPDAAHLLGVRLLFASRAKGRNADLDNLIKLVLDGCNGIVWRDDVQVTELVSRVLRGNDNPRTELVVYTVSDRPFITCKLCGARSYGLEKGLRARQQYCSKTCYDEAQRKGQYVNCFSCGKRVYRKREKFALSDRWFCSPACKAAAKNSERICKLCRRPFMAYTSKRQQFCSPECRIEFERLRPKGRIGRHRPGQCVDCGGPTSTRRVVRCRSCDIRRRSRIAA